MFKQLETMTDAELELTVEEISSVDVAMESEADQPERHPCACCTCF